MNGMDWNKMWKEGMDKASWRRIHGDRIAIWNKKARWYDDIVKKNDRAARMISKLDIDSECTVLDIGAGPGTMAIPLAKVVKHVTAIEPSSGMLRCLKKNARDSCVTNISCINKRWEDIVPSEDIGQCDIVIASFSLIMLDMKAALAKMNELAAKYVYLFTFVGDPKRDYSGLWLKLYGEEYIPDPDYIYIYNLLYNMGIFPNVEIIENKYRESFSNLEEAARYLKEILDISSLEKEEEEIIKSHIREALTFKDGTVWSSYEIKTAVIWWKKENLGSEWP